MKNMSIRNKLIGGFSILLLILAFVGWNGLTNMSSLNDTITALVDVSSEKVKESDRIRQDLLTISRAEKNIILADTQEEMDGYAKTIDTSAESLKQRVQKMEGLVDGEGRVKLREFKQTYDEFMVVNEEVRRLARLNSNKRAFDLSTGKAREAFDEASASMTRLADKNDEDYTRQAKMVEVSANMVKLAARVNRNLVEINRAEKNIILATTKEEMDAYASAIDAYEKELNERLENINAGADAKGKVFVANFSKFYDEYMKLHQQVRDLSRAGKNAEATALSQGKAREVFDKASAAMTRLADKNDEDYTRQMGMLVGSADMVKFAARVNRNLVEINRAEKNIILAKTQEDMDVFAKAIDVYQKELEERVANLEAGAMGEGKVMVANFKQNFANYMALHQQVREISRENGNARAFELAKTKGRALADKAEAQIAAIAKLNDDSMNADNAAADAAYASASTITIGLIIGAIILGVVMIWFLVRSIITPLNRFVNAIQYVEKEGKFDQRVEIQAQDEIGNAGNALNALLETLESNINDINETMSEMEKGNLTARMTSEIVGDMEAIKIAVNRTLEANQRVVGDIADIADSMAKNDLTARPTVQYVGDFTRIEDGLVRALEALDATMSQAMEAVEQTAQSADQVRASSQNLASNSEEQSSAVEEVTSSMEETDAQVKANTESSRTANQLVVETATVANQGQDKMENMVAAMDSIDESSQNIAKIIKVIDEIAFQTNLLALNAAVEAARAGQHGKGFAVVAQEVRNLAARSAKAARETAELIEDAGARVKDGVAVAGETREALDQIVGNVGKVRDLVAEIATASEEQARGIAQVNTAMEEVAKGAQESSQQSEEMASAADELGNLTAGLNAELSKFTLSASRSNTRRSAPVATSAPAPAPKAAPVKHESAADILPLDQDERGFGGF